MRDRLAIPLLLPILAVGIIFLTIFSFGHLLLEVQATRQAWPVAIVIAGLILLVASILANRPQATGWLIYVATALPAAVILSIGMFYLFRAPESKPAESGPVAAVIPPPGPLDEVALDTNGTANRFATTSYTIVAGQPYTLNLVNRGTVLHNWNLRGVTTPDGQPIMTPLLQAGQSASITFTVPQPGTYQFICDVHPVEMVGRLTAVAAASPTPSP